MREADAEPVFRTRMLLVLAAIRDLLGRGDDAELARDRRGVETRLVQAARVAPDTAVRLLCDVADRCGIDDESGRQVLAVWAREPVAAEFARTWFAVDGLLEDHAELGVWLANSIRSGSQDISPEFRRLTRAHLTGLLDKQFERYEFSGPAKPVWQLLYALGPASRPDWFLRLGDLAAARGEEHEAARRYELAERFGGGAQARERVERLHDIAAYHRLAQGITTTEQLKGSGTPSPYRQLVLGAAAVMTDRSPTTQVAEVLRAQDTRLHAPARLLTALDHLRTGNRQGARQQLRMMIGADSGNGTKTVVGADSSTKAGSDADSATKTAISASSDDVASVDSVAANARLLLGALDADDQLITDGARTLLARHGNAWPRHSLVDATTVLTAVSRRDPALFSELIGATGNDPGGELRELHLKVAGTVLADAAHAELFEQPERSDAALTWAGQLLAGVEGEQAARLRSVAARITDIAAGRRASADADRPLDRLAFAELRREGELQPWTPSALRILRESDAENGGGLHHLAIAEHARAYQLELDGDAAAFEQWKRALAVWARLHADDRLWDELRAYLIAVTPDTTPDEVSHAVDNVRAELPGRLLEPHVARVLELRRDQLPRARAHLELIRGADFAPADVARARARLARDAGAQIRRLIREQQLDRALDEARAWVEIDSENIPLAEQALEVGLEAAENARHEVETWAEEIRPTLEQVAAMVEPLCSELGLTASRIATGAPPRFDEPDRIAFAAKYARHEFWLGLILVITTSQRLNSNPYEDRHGFRIGSNHLNNALKLGLPAHKPYSHAHDFLVAAGVWARHSQGPVIGFF
ncbi:hypothetical protein ACFVUS_40600 [Nocardia sp. NPDC058058]|uniref:hypothetical protein n=1 Tax=Nocardia sp. NPDC058058 TaxID=3346317 RepID=UPI0036DCFEF2